MEARNIALTLKQAKEWYNSRDNTLRRLALTAYREEELIEYDYESILSSIPNKSCSCIEYPSEEHKLILALNKLRNLAFFLNKGWKKTSSEFGCSIVYKEGDWFVSTPCTATTKSPDIIYFRSVKEASIAIKIAREEGWLNDLK